MPIERELSKIKIIFSRSFTLWYIASLCCVSCYYFVFHFRLIDINPLEGVGKRHFVTLATNLRKWFRLISHKQQINISVDYAPKMRADQVEQTWETKWRVQINKDKCTRVTSENVIKYQKCVGRVTPYNSSPFWSGLETNVRFPVRLGYNHFLLLLFILLQYGPHFVQYENVSLPTL